MSKKTIWKIIGSIVLVVAVVGLGYGILRISAFFNRPVNKPLELSVADQLDLKPEPVAASIVEPMPVAEVAPDTRKACGNSGYMLVLITGADFEGGMPPEGADAIRLARVDFSEQTVDVLTISRDLLVAVDGQAPENTGTQPIGLAYYYERTGYDGEFKEQVEHGTNFLAQTILDNLGWQSEYYFTLQMNSVQAMVDAVGGVEIDLPEEITTEWDITFPAGPQTLDGLMATEFLRAIQPGGDAARAERQNLFMTALQKQLISFKIIEKAPALLEQFGEAITTDLTPNQLTQLTCLVDKIPQEDITYHVIPEEFLSLEEGELVLIDADGLQAFIREIFKLD